mmetsp:Transcript_2449/g.6045  ORF Transcript_2449/g.6045 Transcript_2449/m.6045 type:complete len:209 (-) Transcript_2449:638-1264(-)
MLQAQHLHSGGLCVGPIQDSRRQRLAVLLHQRFLLFPHSLHDRRILGQELEHDADGPCRGLVPRKEDVPHHLRHVGDSILPCAAILCPLLQVGSCHVFVCNVSVGVQLWIGCTQRLLNEAVDAVGRNLALAKRCAGQIDAEQIGCSIHKICKHEVQLLQLRLGELHTSELGVHHVKCKGLGLLHQLDLWLCRPGCDPLPHGLLHVWVV